MLSSLGSPSGCGQRMNDLVFPVGLDVVPRQVVLHLECSKSFHSMDLSFPRRSTMFVNVIVTLASLSAMFLFSPSYTRWSRTNTFIFVVVLFCICLLTPYVHDGSQLSLIFPVSLCSNMPPTCFQLAPTCFQPASNFLQVAPTCSNLLPTCFQLAPTCFQPAPTCSNLLQAAPSCSNLLQLAPTCSNLLQLAPTCSKLSLTCSNFTQKEGCPSRVSPFSVRSVRGV